MTDDTARPTLREAELRAIRAFIAPIARDDYDPTFGPRHAGELLAKIDRALDAAEPGLDDGRPPLDPDVKAHNDAYMAGLIRGREIEREAATPDPARLLREAVVVAIASLERGTEREAVIESLRGYLARAAHLREVAEYDKAFLRPLGGDRYEHIIEHSEPDHD